MDPYEDYSELTLRETIEKLAESRAYLDKLVELGKAAQNHYDHLSIRVVPDKMEDEGVSVLTLPGIGRVNCRADLRVNTIKGFRASLFDWMRDNGHEDMVTDTINSSTLKAFLKEQMAEGNDVPPEEYLSIHPYTRAVITKV